MKNFKSMAKKTEWLPLEEYPYFPTPEYFEKLQHASLTDTVFEEKDYEEGFFLLREGKPALIYHRRRDDYNSTTIADHIKKQKFCIINYMCEGRLLLCRIREIGNMCLSGYKKDENDKKPNQPQKGHLAKLAKEIIPLLSDLHGIPTKNYYYPQELITLQNLVNMYDVLKIGQANNEQIEEIMWSKRHPAL